MMRRTKRKRLAILDVCHGSFVRLRKVTSKWQGEQGEKGISCSELEIRYETFGDATWKAPFLLYSVFALQCPRGADSAHACARITRQIGL